MASREAIEEALASDDLEEVHDAIVAIGKNGYRDMADRAVPYLTSDKDFLRAAALRTLVFHFHVPEYKETAIRLLDTDPDEEVRQVAAMGLRVFAEKDPALLQHLLEVSVNSQEEDIVRAAAFIAALVAAGIPRAEFPMERLMPNFDQKANWKQLAKALTDAKIPVPAGVAERAAR